MLQDIFVEENLTETTDEDQLIEPSDSVSSKSVINHQLSQTMRTDLIMVGFFLILTVLPVKFNCTCALNSFSVRFTYFALFAHPKGL